ncbi:conserved hypothetical protein [Ancylobacter novellus DSM 506]|uniref:Uncharacterized protein n=1 Tax=Ancylobacter novellus (strain ATCC 8093 / DSM 506 / JCM 20403 / CCM 1077 / IAM 12100 / NBRC 12443 / NCIMB 10456) TaxID=639283 RepID=D7A065_ANCN5|nr:hypothetical protein [Ancylobacter novellus]ADH89326.1 conserved hypothetical protein [Ancylobacter novellus DSM 506]
MYRFLAAAGFLLAFAGAAHWVVPMGRQAYQLVTARDDAARIADLQLDGVLNEARVAQEIDAALKAEDGEMAASFVELAEARGIPVSAGQRASVALINAPAAKMARGAGRFGRGFLTGEGEDLAGLAGATASDLTVWGDVRDLGREAVHWARGEPVDKLMVDLAGVGIVATGATYAAFGAPLTLRAGLSVLKGARRAGVVGGRFAGNLAAALRGGSRGEVATLVSDLGAAGAKAGTRATFAGLRHVDDAAGAARLRTLAQAKGGQTLAVVKTLGRGALFVTEAMARLAFWVMAAVANVIGLIASFNSAVVAMLRPLWKKKRRRMLPALA